MSKIFTKSFLQKAKKSKTIALAFIITMLGVLELNLHLFQELLGEYYGITYLIIATAVAWVRTQTTQSWEDKE